MAAHPDLGRQDSADGHSTAAVELSTSFRSSPPAEALGCNLVAVINSSRLAALAVVVAGLSLAVSGCSSSSSSSTAPASAASPGSGSGAAAESGASGAAAPSQGAGALASPAVKPVDCKVDVTKDGVTVKREQGGDPQITIADNVQPPKDLVMVELCKGSGKGATDADTVTVNYVGVGEKGKKEFDSSYSRGEPTEFPLTGVIEGFSKGLTGATAGSSRLLIIPAAMAYGSQPPSPDIQKDESLVFVVDTLAIQPGS
jgi:peptidylprolyl isomerase